MERLLRYQTAVEGLTPLELLAWAVKEFGGTRLALANSTQVEDQLLTHQISQLGQRITVIFLDTGRHFQETYDCWAQTREAYPGLNFRPYVPDCNELEQMLHEQGPNLFYQSVDQRKLCCQVRKVKPLQRALKGLDAWITGQRAEQSVTRAGLELVEWDEANGLFKVNPLARWTGEQVWAEAKSLGVVINRLQTQGFPSLGCAPCTRAVAAGEDLRSGRWWWEEPEHKECGLHNRPNTKRS